MGIPLFGFRYFNAAPILRLTWFEKRLLSERWPD